MFEFKKQTLGMQTMLFGFALRSQKGVTGHLNFILLSVPLGWIGNCEVPLMTAAAEWWAAWALTWGCWDFYLLTLPTPLLDRNLGRDT